MPQNNDDEKAELKKLADEEAARIKKLAEEEEALKGKKIDPNDPDLVEKLVKQRVEEALKDVKSKLNDAYSARDEIKKKLDAIEAEKHAAEVERLKAAGKDREAFELEKKAMQDKLDALMQSNVQLSRDSVVKEALLGLNFRSEKAANVAFKDIVGQLVRNDKDQWVHNTGVSIKDFIAVYAAHEDQSFLFKPKASSGAGSSESKGSGTSTENKSLFGMTQAQVLKLAAEGKLGRNTK